MNKVQAINILTNLANLAQKNGLIEDIMSAGSVYTALVILSADIQPESTTGEEKTLDDAKGEESEEK